MILRGTVKKRLLDPPRCYDDGKIRFSRRFSFAAHSSDGDFAQVYDSSTYRVKSVISSSRVLNFFRHFSLSRSTRIKCSY
jgi:hypothetical protein